MGLSDYEHHIEAKMEMEAWVEPGPDITLDRLLADFEREGTPVLEVDRENNRILVARVSSGGGE